MEQLRFIAQDIDRVRNVVGGWIGADGQPNTRHIRARFGYFDVPPIDGAYFVRSAAQSINDSTETVLAFGSSVDSEFFKFDGTTIRLGASSGHTLGIFGNVQWATNSTGRRAIHLNIYNINDTLLAGTTLHSFSAQSVDTTFPFSGSYYLPDVYAAHHAKVTVIQTSGGALNMNYCDTNFFLVR